MALNLASKVGKPIHGGLLMSLAMASLIINDTLVKSLSGDVSVGELIFVRGLFATTFLMAAIAATGRLVSLSLVFHPAVLLCAFMDLLITFFFITALFHMPLPNLTALMQSAPLVVTVLAALILKEQVGWRRLSAVMVGFLGVLLVVRPGTQSIDVHVLSALAALCGIAVRDLVTRRIPARVPSIIVALTTAALVTVGGLSINLYGGFRLPPGQALGTIGLSALFLVIGYFLLVSALRAQELPITAPFRYTIIIWSVIAGWWVFGEVPDHLAVAGMVLIAGSGLFTIYREARLRRAARGALKAPQH